MNKLYKRYCIFYISLWSLYLTADKIPMPFAWVDFDAVMCAEKHEASMKRTMQIIGIEGQELYDFFKNMYNQNFCAQLMPDKNPRIPKIIHQIWLGSPLPEALKPFVESCFLFQGGFQYILWTDEQVKKIHLHNQKLFDQSTNFGEKADILRYEILFNYGGVYLDTDMRCFKSLDILCHTFDFFIGIQPLDSQFLQLNQAILGSIPQHPILLECILGLEKNYYNNKGVPARTGPVYFTRVFKEMAGKDCRRDIALPPNYFYPLGAMEKLPENDSELVTRWIQNGAFCAHYWAKTWMPKNYRAAKFRSIDNDESTKNWNK